MQQQQQDQTQMDQQIESLTFEQAMEQLESITKMLTNGDLTLEQSLELYERGMKMSRRCQSFLDVAERQIRMLTQGADGLEEQELEEQTSAY